MIALLGIAGTFISALGGVVMAALDALSILFTFAGGVVRSLPLPDALPEALIPLMGIFVGRSADKVVLRIQAYAAQLGVHSCSCNEPDSNCSYLVNNSIINGGKDTHNQIAQETNRVNRCREAQAATAFTWFAFACFLATCFLSVRSWRSGGIK